MRLYKRNRLRKSTDFEAIRNIAEKAHTQAFVIYLTRAPQNQARAFSRFGIVASKRIGCAVERNRIKRVWRELFRTNQDRLENFDIIINAKRNSLSIPYSKLETLFLESVEKLAKRLEGKSTAKKTDGTETPPQA